MLPSAVGAHSCLLALLFAEFHTQKDLGVPWGCGEVWFLIVVMLINIWTKGAHQQFLKITALLPAGNQKSREELFGLLFLVLKKEKSHKTTLEQLQLNLQKNT